MLIVALFYIFMLSKLVSPSSLTSPLIASNLKLNNALDAVWKFNAPSLKSLLNPTSSHFSHYKTETSCSAVYRPCEGPDAVPSGKQNKKRNKNNFVEYVGCCKYQGLLYLYNVHISFTDYKVQVFDGELNDSRVGLGLSTASHPKSNSKPTTPSKCSQGGSKIPYLPSLVTPTDIKILRQNSHHQSNLNIHPTNQMKITYSSSNPKSAKPSSFFCSDQSKDTRKFHGTVHIIGAHTAGNLFHAINDNILPVLSLFILDKYFNSEFLNLPRILVMAPGAIFDKNSMPHFQLLTDLFDEIIPWTDLKELCATRVVWGSYLRPFYNPTAGILSRLSTDLLRELALAYSPPVPQAFIASLGSKVESSDLFKPQSQIALMQFQTQHQTRNILTSNARGDQLRIAVFSRGSSGKGRSIAGEASLVATLKSFGALAAICSNFSKTSFLEQLGYALHADVIIGLHGAGLVNFVFSPVNSILVELKTVYGYNLDLYSLVSSARRGFHVEIDIRGYIIKPASRLVSSDTPSDVALRSGRETNAGHKSFDKGLIARVIGGILQANRENRTDTVRQIHYSNSALTNGDNFNSPQKMNDIIITPSIFYNQIYNIESRLSSKSHFDNRGLIDNIFRNKSIFGPTMFDISDYCISLPFSRYRDIIGAPSSTYCLGCTENELV